MNTTMTADRIERLNERAIELLGDGDETDAVIALRTAANEARLELVDRGARTDTTDDESCDVYRATDGALVNLWVLPTMAGRPIAENGQGFDDQVG